MNCIEDRERCFPHSAKDAVLAVQPGSGGEAHEELGSVGVGASIGHGEGAFFGVLFFEVLVSELCSVDGLTTSAITSCKVSTLGHEIGDDSVEGVALVVEGLA